MGMTRTPGPARKGLEAMHDASVKVGWFPSSRYPDGTPVAYVAAIQEYGHTAGGIPARPFMRTTIQERGPEWRALMAKGAKAVAHGKMPMAKLMELLGASAAGASREKIAEITSPALAARTLAARARRGNGSDKPLVDTRYMLPTLTHEVTLK